VNNENLGKIDNSHLAIADKSPELANDKRCLELAEHHSDAVDFAKTGFCPQIDKRLLAKEWPDYMERDEKFNNYQSKIILGEIYRDVIRRMKDLKPDEKETRFEYDIDQDLIHQDFEKYIEKAHEILKEYVAEIRDVIKMFGVRNEFELYSGNFSTDGSSELRGRLNQEVVQKRVLSRMIEIKRRYYRIVFSELPDKSGRKLGKNISQEAFTNENLGLVSAIYFLAYFQKKKHRAFLSDYSNLEKVMETILEENFELEPGIRAYGLPWFVYSHALEEIKNKALLISNHEDKSKEKDNQSDQEDMYI
jgi:hypothetical protein